MAYAQWHTLIFFDKTLLLHVLIKNTLGLAQRLIVEALTCDT